MSVTPASNIPISIDYTNRDYYSLRDQLIARIQDRLPNWTASDPADFGVALVEAFAYMGDIINYYIDRNANENFIYTATQRKSLLNLAQTYGYVPAGYRQAYVDITFSNNSETDITLPEGTVVSGQVVTADTVQTVYFTTVADSIVPTTSSYTVTATEGRSVVRVVTDSDATYGEQIGTSLGDPNQSFELSQNPVADGSISIYVQDGDSYSKWTQVQHLLDYGPLDLVYTVSSDENNNIFVNFGDGVSGVIPIAHSAIRAVYTVGGGIIGNVSTDTVDTLSYVPGLSELQLTALQSAITVANNSVAVGGSDPESNNQIRRAAPGTLRAANRAITLKDFNDLAVSVSGVGKANATAAVWTSVTLYIAPSRNDNDPDLQPGLDDSLTPTQEFLNIKSAVETFLTDKTLIGTTVTVQPPTYVDCVLTIQYVKLAQYTTAEVELNLKNSLLTAFGYNGMNFADTIYPQDIEYVLNQTPGVKTVKLVALSRYGDSGLNTLTGTASEIFRFQETNINIGEA